MAELADGPQGVMPVPGLDPGIVPAIHSAQRTAASAKPQDRLPPPPVALARNSFLRRRSVDGRACPGHDGKGSRNNR